MRKILPLLLYFCISTTVFAQHDLPQRTTLNEDLAPFYHGIASGDATADKVIIWTRITTDAASANVTWRIAKDSLFSNIIDQGVFTTDASRDYTVKVDVLDLDENTFYFYEFEDEEGHRSKRGRTKTIPTKDVSNFRAAIVSCSSYPHGYFNVYDRISERNDFDAIFHLGDYIYEYGLNEYGKNPSRKPDPQNPLVSLTDYRTRYSQYHLDTMLQNLHQQYPFYNVWDDHEFANNSWRDGANNHFPNKQGDWNSRKSAALQAYLEWIPIREIDPDNKFKIYRSMKIGDLVEVFFLDTRIIERDNEKDEDGPNKRLIGEVQMDWLQQGLKNSTAKWKVIAQQVMMGPLEAFGLVLNSDQWDGYSFERARLFDFINNNNIDNIVVLTGDIHTFWANDLPFGKEKYDPEKRNAAAVEFVTSAVSSPGLPFAVAPQILSALNPNIRDVQLDKRGYILLDVNDERAQGDYYFIQTVNKPQDVVKHRVSWYTPDGQNRLFRNKIPSVAEIPNIDFVPQGIRENTVTSINQPQFGTILGAYPNPFISTIGLQFYVDQPQKLTFQIFDMAGKLVRSESLGLVSTGLHYRSIEANELPAGQYRINITDGTNLIGRNVVKIQ
ncbi:MAG TPA: alkaline phosphatase D family protein [Chitinophagales bacterium]|nr:alkaline phosphatase D family protein [Chitinophagales bacterium]